MYYFFFLLFNEKILKINSLCTKRSIWGISKFCKKTASIDIFTNLISIYHIFISKSFFFYAHMYMYIKHSSLPRNRYIIDFIFDNKCDKIKKKNLQKMHIHIYIVVFHVSNSPSKIYRTIGMNFLVIWSMKFIENLIVNSINFYRLIFSFNFFTETEYFSIVHCLEFWRRTMFLIFLF